MKSSGAVFTVLSLLSTVLARPANYAGYVLPTCGASDCLTDGYFDGCAPGDLICLCSLEQDSVSCYVRTVQPCLDGEPGKKSCTAGAVANYKQLLASVCSKPEYGNLNKTVAFAPNPSMT